VKLTDLEQNEIGRILTRFREGAIGLLGAYGAIGRIDAVLSQREEPATQSSTINCYDENSPGVFRPEPTIYRPQDREAAQDAEVVKEMLLKHMGYRWILGEADWKALAQIAIEVVQELRGMVPASQAFSVEQLEQIDRAILDNYRAHGMMDNDAFRAQVLARLTPPAKPTAEERVTVTSNTDEDGIPYWTVFLDGVYQMNLSSSEKAFAFKMGMLTALLKGKE
jgi:hypothetical protein